MVDSQVKQVVKNFPHYLGDCLVVNTCTVDIAFKVLRVEALVTNQVRYIDLIIDAETNQFLTIGQTSDTPYNFTISGNICKTLALVAYMKEAY